MYRKYFKRMLDFTLSLIAIIVLSPVLLITAILVRIKIGNPVIFKQKRPGLNEKIFTLYKFRTMTNEKDGNGQLLPDEIRLTKFGKALRSLSLDELPQLFNILNGDMSIIGPRPLLIEYLKLYTKEQAKRHEVRPGLSGLAQVNGRNTIAWEDKFKYDVEYVDNVTFILDIKVIIESIKIVFKKVGISQKNCATVRTFKGSEDTLVNEEIVQLQVK